MYEGTCLASFRRRQPPEPTLSIMVLNRIKSVLIVVGFMFREQKKHLMDYRCSLIKTMAMRPSVVNSGRVSLLHA